MYGTAYAGECAESAPRDCGSCTDGSSISSGADDERPREACAVEPPSSSLLSHSALDTAALESGLRPVGLGSFAGLASD